MLALALLAWIVLAQVPAAWASSFTVEPIRIVLGGRAKSAFITLRNTTERPIRFQLSVASWSQSPDGAVVLSPTQDVVLFPALLTLAPGESRKARVATLAPPGPVERTYRVYVDELPPLAEPQQVGAQVRVLTKMGIPVFVVPPTARPQMTIEGPAVARGRVAFAFRNDGNVHALVKTVRLVGLGAAGELIVQGQLPSWYVLAGGVRQYDVTLSGEDCEKLASLVVEVEIGERTISERVTVPGTACSP